jgi:hypothetical protein
VVIGVFRVEPVELRGEQARLVAACAGTDFHHGVARVTRVRRDHRRQDRLVHLLHLALQVRQFRASQFLQIGVASRVFEQCLRLGDLAFRFFVSAVIVHELQDFLLLAADVGGFARVGIKRRVCHLRIEFIEAALKRSDVGQLIHGKIEIGGLADGGVGTGAAVGRREGDLRIAPAAQYGLLGRNDRRFP